MPSDTRDVPLLASPPRLLAEAVRHPARAAAVAGNRMRRRGPAWTPAGSRSLIDAADGAPRPVRRVDAVPDRVLHVVTNALPHVQAGYTLRTQELVAAQRSVGIDAEVVTRWGWPVEQGLLTATDHDQVGGVAYHRLLPAGG